MQTTLVPHVIDALVSLFESMTVSITDAQGNPISLVVYDGYPGPNFEDTFVSVGGTLQPTARARQQPAALGQPNNMSALDENVEILCYAQAGTGGGADADPVAGTNDDSQKLCRDNAYAIVQAADTALRANAGLDGLGGAATNVPLLQTGWAYVTAGDLTQTSGDTAQWGRFAIVEFTVHYFSRLRSF